MPWGGAHNEQARERRKLRLDRWRRTRATSASSPPAAARELEPKWLRRVGWWWWWWCVCWSSTRAGGR
eukprot:12887775-Prorocentrum_lima.AAC.1